MASRNGLNPKIRGPKGVGYGRALPAPFSFGNGLCPDGVDDYLLIPGLVGKTWPLEGTIEFWATVLSDSRSQREIEIQFNDGSNLRFTAYHRTSPTMYSAIRQSSSDDPPGTYALNNKYHYCFMWDANYFYSWGSALLPNVIVPSTISSNINLVINGIAIGGQVDGSLCSTTKLDELRFYNRKLKLDEIIANDNNGIGNNPNTTENLFAWYIFEQFEMLDFSVLQDGSDIGLGIRDISGQNHHASEQYMDTSPSSSTYALKPF